MATCSYCGTTILFGGKTDGSLRYCNEKCWNNGRVPLLAQQIPDELIQEHVESTHAGNCPKCSGPGPVDVHTSYRVLSALAFTRWWSRPVMCCRLCGNKQRWSDCFYSLALGWWGFPWGLIMTPVQVFRNVKGLMAGPDSSGPSEALASMVRSKLAKDYLDSQNALEQEQPAAETKQD